MPVVRATALVDLVAAVMAAAGWAQAEARTGATALAGLARAASA